MVSVAEAGTKGEQLAVARAPMILGKKFVAKDDRREELQADESGAASGSVSNCLGGLREASVEGYRTVGAGARDFGEDITTAEGGRKDAGDGGDWRDQEGRGGVGGRRRAKVGAQDAVVFMGGRRRGAMWRWRRRSDSGGGGRRR